MKPLGVLVAGAVGRMGRLVVEVLATEIDLTLAGTLLRGQDPEDIIARTRPAVLVDFTIAEASRVIAPLAARHGVSPIVGTSGLLPEDLDRLAAACEEADVGGLVVPNFSLGAVLQMRAAAEIVRHMRCQGIHEEHHKHKRDTPSGTARATAGRLSEAGGESVPITSERREGILARQTIRFAGKHESLSLEHEVGDRRAYLPGVLLAVRAVRRLHRLEHGLESLLL